MLIPIDPSTIIFKSYDLVVIGTGFGSSFFLHKALQRRPDLRVLVLEWGRFNSHTWRMENLRHSNLSENDTYTTNTPWKPWWFTIGFGGGTNCWGAYPPRFHPNDFRLNTLYGVGVDWPFGYDELEPFYVEAEELMYIAGDNDISSVIPRSKPFPQRPHRLSSPDMVMKQAMPQWHFGAPSARMLAQRGGRGPCCAAMRCELCPVDSKFTIENGMSNLYCGNQIDVLLEARVTQFDVEAGRISGVVFSAGGRDYRASGDLYILGANAIQSPFILLKSGISDKFTGNGIFEKLGFSAEVFLRGMKNFDGGARNVGVNYSLYDGQWRRTAGAALINFQNFWLHGVRIDRDRWQEVLPLAVSIEDLPSDSNRVTVAGDMPNVEFYQFSEYSLRSIDRVMKALPELLVPLPVEKIVFRALRNVHGHHQGTVRMGTSQENSVVDAKQVHHRYRNLVVVGNATFPTSSAANPSLTVAASSLRAAQRLF